MSSIRRTSDRSIDWEAVKSRLARAAEAVVAEEQPSAERTRQILAARAERLAQVPERTPDACEILELLTFQLGHDAFAIETRYVQEVQRPREITLVPGVPPFLVGVTNLRGEVLAVMDIRLFWGSRAQPDQAPANVIVLGLERPEFGIVADAVDEVATWRMENILAAPPSVSAEGRRYLKGVTAEAMLVMDGAVLLQDSTLYVDQDDEALSAR